jgi:photosystem II stability/assembly factor-like uncharacterized protein
MDRTCLLALAALCVLLLPVTASSQSWHQLTNATQLQPTAFAVTRGGVLFVAHPDLGLYRSFDDGQTWLPSGKRLASTAVFSVGCHPSGIIVASASSGLYRSTNGGDDWEMVDATTATILAFAFDSVGTIFAGTASGEMLRSNDLGKTWMHSQIGKSGARVDCIAVSSKGTIVAGVDDRTEPTRPHGGIYRSINGGTTWQVVSSFNTDYDAPVICLASTPRGRLIAGTTGERTRGGSSLFSSTDDGMTWSLMPMAFTHDVSFNTLAVTGRGEILTNYQGSVQRSTDEGSTWTRPDPAMTASPWSIQLSAGSKLYALAGGTLYRTVNAGSAWQQPVKSFAEVLPNQLTLDDVRCVASSPRNSQGYLYVATAGLGLWRFQGYSTTCTRMNGTLFGDTLFTVFFDRGEQIYAGGPRGGFRSSDNGATWMQLSFDSARIAVLAFAQDTAHILYAATDGAGVYRSTDDGHTWATADNELSGRTVNWLKTDAHRRLFAGTQDAAYVSEDHGLSWNRITDTLGGSIHAVEVSHDGLLLFGTDHGIVAPSRIGDEWIAMSNGLPDDTVLALAINADGHLLAGTSSGLFHSVNGGRTWSASGTRFAGVRVQSIDVNPLSGAVIVGTDRLGAFWSEQYTKSVPTGVNEIDEVAVNSSRAAPNPFAGTTTITFNLRTAGNVRLAICTVTGQQICTLAEGRMEAGEHKVEWKADAQPSGSYIYRLQTSAGISTGVLLLRR